MEARECIFCSRQLSGNRAKEHVVPEWLLAHLAIRSEVLYQAVAESADSSITNARSMINARFVEGRVCDECNEGWMQELENAAAPLLISLIDGAKSAYDLTDSERLVLARWTTKTSYVLTYPTPLGKPVQSAHLRHLATSNDPPEGVIIVANQHSHNGEFSYFQKNTWPQFCNEQRPNQEDGRYKIALQFRKLLLLAAHFPDAAGYALAAGIHLPIWPIKKLYGSWSCGVDVLGAGDSRLVLQQFGDQLAVLYEH